MRRASAALAALVLAVTSVQIARAECQQCVNAPCCPKTDVPHQELRSLPPCCVVSAAAPATPRPPASPEQPRLVALVPEGVVLFTTELSALAEGLAHITHRTNQQDLYQRKCSYLL
ncbi:MAG TPA: hypothetical protein VH877_21900 [Polyangia bacterium]|jgi:hypothetical protein|nr:hypothetical protein [Polyangia bacterium]